MLCSALLFTQSYSELLISVVIYEVKYESYPKNISAVKKGEAKKVQVTERPKDVMSL